MLAFFERHTLSIHILVIVAGIYAGIFALLSGEWRALVVSAFAYWFTVKT